MQTLKCVAEKGKSRSEQSIVVRPAFLRDRAFLLGAELLGGPLFVAHGLRMPDDSILSFTVVGQPEAKDDAVGLRGGFCHFLGFPRRTVQALHSARGNFDGVVVVELLSSLQ